MLSEVTKFDFLIKEFFRAQSAGNKQAENYYQLELMSYRQSDLERLSNKYTKLGQHGSGDHKYTEKKINEKYDFFLLQTIPKTIDAVTQTDISCIKDSELIGINKLFAEEEY